MSAVNDPDRDTLARRARQTLASLRAAGIEWLPRPNLARQIETAGAQALRRPSAEESKSPNQAPAEEAATEEQVMPRALFEDETNAGPARSLSPAKRRQELA